MIYYNKKIKRRTVFLLIPLLVIFMQCNKKLLSNKNVINGNGKLIEKIINAPNITKIECNAMFNLIIKQGETQEIKIETDENISQYFTYKTVGEKIIFNAVNINNPTKANIYITIKEIRYIESNTLNININNFIENCDVDIINSGFGCLTTENFICRSINLENKGLANAIINGKANNFRIINSSMGIIDAENFEADSAEVNNEGVGSIYLFATKELTINNNGTGCINYKGTPIIKKIINSGLGKVKKYE